MIIKRNQYLQKLTKVKDTEFIKVITGVRRSGKSFVLKMFQEHLLASDVKESQIFYYNFEMPSNFDLLDEQSLYKNLLSKMNTSEKTYLMFDEIQLVQNWQRLINGLRAEYDADIYITGSNASLLSGELATFLSGRYIEISIYPLSFQEFLDFKGINEYQKYLSAFQEYSQIGGFPSVTLQTSNSLIEDVLDGIFDSVILKDVNLRSEVREPETLVKLARFLMANIGQPVSINKITNTLKSQGAKTTNRTIENYLRLLEDSFLFYKAQRYNIKGKEYLNTQAKYFSVDIGLRNRAIRKVNADKGSQLENIVYLELKRRGYTVFVGQYGTKEIDFVAIKSGKIEYFQMAYQMPENSTRETDNMIHLPDNYKKTLITSVYSETEEVDGVQILNIIDFLLST